MKQASEWFWWIKLISRQARCSDTYLSMSTNVRVVYRIPSANDVVVCVSLDVQVMTFFTSTFQGIECTLVEVDRRTLWGFSRWNLFLLKGFFDRQIDGPSMIEKCYAIIFGTLIFVDEGGCPHALLLVSKIVLTFHSTLRYILVTPALRIGVSDKAYEVRYKEKGSEFIVGIVCWVLKWCCQVKSSKVHLVCKGQDMI